jgi:hypothetical protein
MEFGVYWEMSEGFTTLLGNRLSLVPANRSWMPVFTVGMDSATALIKVESATASPFLSGGGYTPSLASVGYDRGHGRNCGTQGGAA